MDVAMENTERIFFREEREQTERALLCSLLLKPANIAEVRNSVRTEMFSNPQFGFVYEALCSVFDRGNHPDMALVDMEMKCINLERFHEMGGLSVLADGMEEFRLSDNVNEYAREIKRHFILSSLYHIFTHKALECMQYDTDYHDIITDCIHKTDRLLDENRDADGMETLASLASLSISFQEERMRLKEDPRMMRTGIRGLDGIIGGLYRKEMLVIGGMTSDGKTAVSMHIAMNEALKGKHVLHFSFEMTGDQTVERFFTHYAHVEADRLRIGGLREADIERMKKYAASIEHLPYHFVNDAGMSLDSIRSEILTRSRRGECDVVLVDYLHAMVHDDGKSASFEQQVRRIVTALKKDAEEANCALILVSQLNREYVKRGDKGYIPYTSDLRDSGAIDFVADSVIILSRPERFNIHEDNEGRSTANMLQLYVLKNRNGLTGLTQIYHKGDFSYFYEYPETLPFEGDE